MYIKTKSNNGHLLYYKSFSHTCLQSDLAGLYIKSGMKNIGIMFLMTDSQVADEKFLVLINDMLASGEIPELFADDEVDNIISTLGPEVITGYMFL